MSKNEISQESFDEAVEAFERMCEDFETLNNFFRRADKHIYERLRAYGLAYVAQGLMKETFLVGDVYNIEKALEDCKSMVEGGEEDDDEEDEDEDEE